MTEQHMAHHNSAKPAGDTVTASRHSMFDIAGDLEGAVYHLSVMLKLSREKLSEIDSQQSASEILERTGSTQSLLDAAELYLDKIRQANDQVYQQARILPVELKVASSRRA